MDTEPEERLRSCEEPHPSGKPEIQAILRLNRQTIMRCPVDDADHPVCSRLPPGWLPHPADRDHRQQASIETADRSLPQQDTPERGGREQRAVLHGRSIHGDNRQSFLNLCELDLISKTFYAEGMVWLKYADLPTWLDHWDREIIEAPVRALRFVNNVDRHDLSLELEPVLPVQDADGLNIQWLKFSGRFVANDLNLRMFPFETLHLSIEVELEDLYASETNLTYEPSGSLLATGGDLSGYRIIQTAVTQAVHSYSTNWGWKLAVSCNGAENLAEVGNSRTELIFQRSSRSSLLNIFLPLAVMMCVALSVPLIDIQQHENRVVIPASVLLVLVFLQEGYKKILPAGLNYPTLADLIYSSCFISTIGIFLWSVASANLFLESATANQPAISDLNQQGSVIVAINVIFLLSTNNLLWLRSRREQSRAKGCMTL